MPLSAGHKLGPYQILAPIGAGGMGEVYKARDTRLDRVVAIKVLPAHFADRPELRERFDREARTIASLNHPHICVLYDVGHQDGIDFLVMEYLEGETLAQRLAKGPLRLEQVWQYAIEMADALDKAHRKGVTHRDLKPGNIILTRAGSKLVDFGLAKLKQNAVVITPPSGRGSEMDTKTNPLTAHGMILGTLQYMAPEQVEGHVEEIDARTDIFAFGVVVYEMATGRKAFEGQSPASLTAAILDREPASMSSLQPVTPPPLERAVKKCLAKDPDKRWQSAGDLCDELNWIAEGGGQAATPPVARPGKLWERIVWVVAAVVLLVAVSFLAVSHSRTATSGDVVSFAVYPPDRTAFSSSPNVTADVPQFALSPDGRTLAFVVSLASAGPMIWLRSLAEVAARPLSGTENAQNPFWSPDSRWIGFFADGKVKKIPAAGGAVQVVTETHANFLGGAWGPDDTILFASGTEPINRVNATGGTAAPVTTLDGVGTNRFPQFLPDGNHFLYFFAGKTGVYAGSLDGATKKLLIRLNGSAVYAPPGYLLFVDGDTLMGQAFNADLEVSGQPFLVAEHAGHNTAGLGAVTASRDGTIAYAGTLFHNGRLSWFDRGGIALGSAGPEGDYCDFRLAPDERSLAASLVDPKTGTVEIWIIDLVRNSTSRFASGGALAASPVWSPDGTRLTYRTTRIGSTEFFQRSAGGGGGEAPALTSEMERAAQIRSTALVPTDWSPDGSNIIFSAPAPASGSDLWMLPLGGEKKPMRFLALPSDEMHGNFSPNGRFVAYSSNESGKFEVYVQTFPLSDRKLKVSTNGGYEPRWRGDGREIYYLSEDRKLMTVSVRAGPSFGVPQALFQTQVPAGVAANRTHYVPSRDGRRFLVNTQSGEPSLTPITVVLNWTAGLKK